MIRGPTQVPIRCQTQGCDKELEQVQRCSLCQCAFYCSVDCQRKDWPAHKQHVCSLWSEGSGRVNNPWYSASSLSLPATLETRPDEKLFVAAKSGDLECLRECVANGSLLNVARGRQGETALHFAVMSGNPDAIRLLLGAGAYTNAEDWRGNVALYYACTHSGEDNVLKDNEDKRTTVGLELMMAGGDTMKQGGFSGERPFERARALGHTQLANCIESSSLHEAFQFIRRHLNDRIPPPDVAQAVRRFIDLHWRGQTVRWFIQLNRGGLMGNFKPHPQLVAQFRAEGGNLESVERMFVDCQARHQSWWKLVEKLADK